MIGTSFVVLAARTVFRCAVSCSSTLLIVKLFIVVLYIHKRRKKRNYDPFYSTQLLYTYILYYCCSNFPFSPLNRRRDGNGPETTPPEHPLTIFFLFTLRTPNEPKTVHYPKNNDTNAALRPPRPPKGPPDLPRQPLRSPTPESITTAISHHQNDGLPDEIESPSRKCVCDTSQWRRGGSWELGGRSPVPWRDAHGANSLGSVL